MEAIGGLTPTGRQFSGACTDLVELVDGDRLRHAALVFHSPFRGHEALGASLDALRGAMSRPGVVGLAPLVHDDGSQGAWV